MTNKEYVKHLLDMNVREHGEDDFMTQQLRAQLRSMEYFEKVNEKQQHQEFHIGSRQGPPEAHPAGLEREDMYGNPVLSPEEKAEAEAEEEKRQQKECAKRGRSRARSKA
jgi:hypothetical protein